MIRFYPGPKDVQTYRVGLFWYAWCTWGRWHWAEPGEPERGGSLRVEVGPFRTRWGARRAGWRRLAQIRILG